MLFHIFTILVNLPPFTRQSSEMKLSNRLMKDHSRFTRPVLNTSKPVVVTFGFELIHIISILESEQTIIAKVWMRMSWVSEFITWKPQQWNDVKLTKFNSDMIWTPDIYLIEDVSDEMSGQDRYKTPIICHYNGTQQWLIPALLKSSCKFDVTNFPYDHQRCYFTFVPWTNDKNELDLRTDTRPIVTSNYIKSPEWSLISVEKKVSEEMYSCCPNPYVIVLYTLEFHRRSLYYVFNAIVPCFIQMIIILFTFFYPPECGERIGVVITVLLVFAVYLEVIGANLPKTSNSIPALSMFYITAMAVSSCSLLATSCVLVVHFKGSQKSAKPVPRWLRRVFLDNIGVYLGVYSNLHENNENNKLLGIDKEELCQCDENENKYISSNKVGTETCNGHAVHPPREYGDIVDEVRVITRVIQNTKHQDKIEGQWQTLARVLDRLFFLFFLLIFVVLTVAILLPIYIAYVKRDGSAPHVS